MLNDAGRMVAATLQELWERFPHVALDEMIVMPDHVHVIFALMGARHGTPQKMGEHLRGTSEGSLGRVVQAFKSLSTVAYTHGVRQQGWLPFAGKLWQRNYYERIIRGEQELANMRTYIVANPARWRNDVFQR